MVDRALTAMDNLDQLWRAHSEHSDLAALNRNAGETFTRLRYETLNMLQKGTELEESFGGAFNMFLGPVTALWGFQTDRPGIPDSAAIAEALPSTKGGLVFSSDSAMLEFPGMKLDVGGIAKGEAVDMAVFTLMNLKVEAFIVEAGGDLRTFGLPKEGKQWRIGIAHPRKPGALYGTLKVGQRSVATSGDYQQFFIEDGKRYHHIIDPETGWPADRCVSATVVAQTCTEADAAATALFVMGPEKGMEWLAHHSEYQGLIIYLDQKGKLKHKISPALEDSFKLR